MSPRADIICWLDLETTGAAPSSDILEIGLAITGSSPDLPILREFSAVVQPRDGWDHFLRDALDPVVIDMHTKNGLFDEVEVADRTASDLEDEIIGFLGQGSQHIPLAGSGVCHFDRQFIRRDLPKVDRRLTYWSYDVGVMRRMLRLARASALAVSAAEKPHRALNDVLWAIDEARTYLKLLGSL